ncbi:hypothetical protein [Roseateles chitosanitabidus]|uniref:hypothetical protein n=1 Tax=Roseateles chitosanitabidus TaxID=65048 RepID=UPI000831D634|nr:hypothetical protein [Roseateles chitosanitabidus]
MKMLPILILAIPLLSIADERQIAHTDGRTIWIENGPIGLQDIEFIEAMFNKHWNIEEIRLRDIPGGDSIADKFLFAKFANKRIVVSGKCLSVCTLLALAGDPIVLETDAVLALHGTYSSVDGRLNEDLSLSNLDWLAGRLPAIPKAALRTALTYPRRDEQGMVIAPAQDGSRHIVVMLCERLPDGCTQVTTLAEGESRLTIAPAAKP